MNALKNAYMVAVEITRKSQTRLAHMQAEYAAAESELQAAQMAESEALKAYANECGIPLRLLGYWGVPAIHKSESEGILTTAKPITFPQSVDKEGIA